MNKSTHDTQIELAIADLKQQIKPNIAAIARKLQSMKAPSGSAGTEKLCLRARHLPSTSNDSHQLRKRC
jgi:hypothetical protein